MACLITLIIDPTIPSFRRVVTALQEAGVDTVVLGPDLPKPFSIKRAGQDYLLFYDGIQLNRSSLVWNYYKSSYQDYGCTTEWLESYVVGSQCRSAIGGLISLFGDRVVNSLISLQRVNSKLLQQQTAERLGFAVPDTLVSNLPNETRTWAKPLGSVIIKALDSPVLPMLSEHPGLSQDMIATCRVTADMLADLGDDLCPHPNFMQAEIPKAYEIRAVMVDGQPFVARINSQQHKSTEVDWRQGIHKVKMEVMPHDKSLTEFMGQFLAHYNLFSGVFDFIVTPAGKQVFLECNAQGMWGRVDQVFDFAISKAFADALIQRAHKN
ncbi:MAG: hypothetical protein JNM52_02420 [Betaproteobacteria bacterium]|nr:hypothetical protein [Betaproteobacteria bacterium]